MDPQALAGDYTGCTANLEAIARHHVGADVRVQWQPSEHWLGLARRTANGFEILLNPYAGAVDLPFILFHETAHLVLGHAVIVSTCTPADMANDSTAERLDRLTPPEQAAWGAAIDAREDDANEWAHAALKAFESRFGPFLKAIQ